MKLISFLNKDNSERAGIIVDNRVYDIAKSSALLSLEIPSDMLEILRMESDGMNKCRELEKAITDGKVSDFEEDSSISPLAPVPHPTSCRDAYAFRQHVATARRNRGLEMIPEFDQFPVFYFTNHNSIIGPGELVVEEDHLHKLDFELEVAIVIGKRGKNISEGDADNYIAGYTIMNDFSARLLQMEEMKLNLGPAKGKDFATSIGPWLVTPDELVERKIDTSFGAKYDLRMIARHNGELISDGNLKDMNFTFAEIIERVSYGVEIFPGDVIGSGTVGTGCYLELNGTRILEAKAKGDAYHPIWLKEDDTIELDVACLGKLSHTIVRAKIDRSILAKKKMNESVTA
ncbi:MAG: fumarylacetoacetate hydrolase family protein [candidate division Zixibacteria bacterium]|nr:fumarylacetoacetate hydrolase family protein [candidate division Zixibacteria bacterium]